MAWLIPQSQTNTVGTAVPLGTTDSVFIGADITVASTGGNAIFGTGSNHEVLVYGTLASTGGFFTIGLGLTAGTNSGQLVTVKAGGHVQGLGASPAINIIGFGSRVTNEGLISALTGSGIQMSGDNLATTTSMVNSGTIQAGNVGIQVFGTEAHALTNGGLISGVAASYIGADSRDVITNTGRMVGTIQMNAGNDTYNGATGRLTGTVFGGDGNDTITGGLDNNRFEGGNENDTLNGRGGADILIGGGGTDFLTGGLGQDKLTGGFNADRFIFTAISDSIVAASGRDTILDFTRVQTDKIQLVAIDANSTKVGNQAFGFIGTKVFSEKAGELRYQRVGNDTLILGDVNGDGKADFAILSDKVVSFIAGDFIL